MTLFRPHRSSLAEAMAQVAEVNSLAELELRIADVYDDHSIGTFAGRPTVQPYEWPKGSGPVWDARIGWSTHVVMVGGIVAGFTDGPISAWRPTIAATPEIAAHGLLWGLETHCDER